MEISHLMYGTFVRKTPTLILNVFLVGLSSVLRFVLIWFWFGRKFSGENREKMPIPVSSPTLFRLGE